MSSEDLLISIEGIGKRYRLYERPMDRILQALALTDKVYYREVRALEDISIQIRRGETIGIIGRNGSGKSTLLQLMCGILKPSSGHIERRGRIAALLELGAGFHPEYTGRENVYMQGAVMGISRQVMQKRFDDIVAFADIGDFIDQQIKTYSSGMFLRLAFAVAINVDPDILIVDEAMAVGDMQFQRRCYARIKELQSKGLTLVFVSHDHELVRTLTSRALLLDRGKALYLGATSEATRRYRRMLFEEEAVNQARIAPDASQPADQALVKDSLEYGIGNARIAGLKIVDSEGVSRTGFVVGEPIRLDIAVDVDSPLDKLNISAVIRTLQGVKVYSWGTFNQDIAIWADETEGEIFWEKSFAAGEQIAVTLALEGNLGQGDYEVQVVVSRELGRQYGSQQILHWRDELGFFRVTANPAQYFFGGICDLKGKAILHA